MRGLIKTIYIVYLSRYIKQFGHTDPDYTLLYSTKKTSAILISKAVLKTIEDNTISQVNRKKLTELGFLVRDRDSEKKELLSFYDEANSRNRTFNAFLILNLDCNLNCVYCYEGELKTRLYMSQETADAALDFIKRACFGNADKVWVDFYGGEPLLSAGLIKYISGDLKASAEKTGSEYAFGLVTNGTLLTGKMTEELIKYGLESARITIDGPMENHNRFRPFKTGAGTFDLIMQNIKETCGLIGIHIGGAYTIDNYREFPKLLDCLIAEGITPEKVASVKFDPVTKSPFNRSEFRGGCSSINEPWLSEAGLFLREEILSRGFNTPKMSPAACMVEIKNAIAINHDGGILKCPAFMGWEGLEAGNIRTGIKDYKESHGLDLWRNRECADCEYLPMCLGGCRYMKLLRDSRLDGVDCKRQYLDATLETLVKQDLKYSQKMDADIG